MSTGLVLKTIIDTFAVAFMVWGIFNEDVFVRFEDKIRAAVKRRKLKVSENKSGYNKHCA
ncbi:MAG: hypothetical protein KBS52_06505 [Clostridiales bacterium]|nr:hypothetical protein [Candidatus Equinaster intestinalis]